VNAAVETAQFGQEAKFNFPAYKSFPEIEVMDTTVESVPIDDMIGPGPEMLTLMIEKHSGNCLRGRGLKNTMSVI
jgi:PmbA protein